MDRQDISRNDLAARHELTQQALALSLIRPVTELLNARRGKGEGLSECDVVAVTMLLFDHMLYHETSSSCPGTTRQEAETILVSHFKEANPDWNHDTQIAVAQNIFRLLTPKDGFRYVYYDFNDFSHKEHFFRLVDWDLKENIGALYRLTTHGILLYSTRLEDNGLEIAIASAVRANRTLRRGEIELAIEMAHSTVTNLKRFRLRINAGLRDARIGDTSFTFDERMKPILDDSYELLEEILQQTADTLNRINKESKGALPEKRKKLLRAEEKFQDIINECKDFKNYIGHVQLEYLSYRRELIGMRDLAIVSRDLTESILKPMLNCAVTDIAEHSAHFLSLLLPPSMESKSTRKTHYCIDPISIQSTYTHWLEQQYEADVYAIDNNAQFYSDPPSLLTSETIEKANCWIDEYTKKFGKISFQNVISCAETESMDDSLVLTCMLIIGSYATSNKKNIDVIINGVISHPKWKGDNLGIRFHNLPQSK